MPAYFSWLSAHRGKETLKSLSTLQLIVLCTVYSLLVRCSVSALAVWMLLPQSFAYRILLKQININVYLLVLMSKTVMMMSPDETWDDASCWWWWWAEHTGLPKECAHTLSWEKSLLFFIFFLLTWISLFGYEHVLFTLNGNDCSTGHLSHSVAAINSMPLIFLSN